MKPIIFENLINRQKYECSDIKDVTTIEGIEYIRVSEVGSLRKHLMRKDALKRVEKI